MQGSTSFNNAAVNTNITFSDISEVKEFCDDFGIDRSKFDSDYNLRDRPRSDIQARYRGNFAKVQSDINGDTNSGVNGQIYGSTAAWFALIMAIVIAVTLVCFCIIWTIELGRQGLFY